MELDLYSPSLEDKGSVLYIKWKLFFVEILITEALDSADTQQMRCQGRGVILKSM